VAGTAGGTATFLMIAAISSGRGDLGCALMSSTIA
jgi:hypothetical protein